MNETLDSRQLKAFVVLAKTGSHTETAKRLYVTHSAISHAMRTLEEQVGCRLFAKLRKKVVLTEAGEALLYHANRVLAEMQQACLTLTELNQWGSRQLRLAANAILLSKFLAPVLLKFHEEFPRVSLHVQACGLSKVTGRLENNRVDIALSAKPSAGDQFEFVPLFADRFHLVVSAAHPLAAKPGAPRGELAKYPFVLLYGSGHERKQVDDFFSRSGITPNIIGEIENLDVVKAMLARAPFMSFLPGWVMASEIENRSLVTLPVGRKPLEQTWGLVHSRNRPLNHAESTLLKLCRKQVAKFA